MVFELSAFHIRQEGAHCVGMSSCFHTTQQGFCLALGGSLHLCMHTHARLSMGCVRPHRMCSALTLLIVSCEV